MSKFTDGAPRTPKEWHDLGYYIMPCTSEGIPMIKGWNQEDYSDQLIKKGNWNSKVYGLRLDEIVDIDIDNPFVQKFLNNIKKLSKYFFINLNLLKKKYPKIIKEIRGRGLLIGIQLYTDQTKFIKKLMDNRLLTIRAAENVVLILPPLNVKIKEIDLALKIINKVCSEIK